MTEPPTVQGDSATGTMRGKQGNSQKDFTFALLKREGTWCASYNWGSVG
ncbi:hypothetical protein [Amycolatopsis palatopharyngis]|nr:hypothetical protein [Amycolatopsis palatopharyngis]